MTRPRADVPPNGAEAERSDERVGQAGGPCRGPVEAGAEIGAALWRDRPLVDARREAEALAYFRGSRRNARAASSSTVPPDEILGSLSADESATSPIAGVLERTGRELRLALAHLSRCTIQRPTRGYEPEDDDALAALSHVERTLRSMTKAVYLEDAARTLALHAAACGRLPEAQGDPGLFDAAGPGSGVLERVGRALGVDGRDVAAAAAVARAWGWGELVEGEARDLFRGLVRIREELERAGVPMKDPPNEDDGGGAAPAAREVGPRPPRGEPGPGSSAPASPGGWRVSPVRRGAGAS